MLGEEFQNKIKSCRKILDGINKDIKYRGQMEKQGQAAYQLDSQVKGAFVQLEEERSYLQVMCKNFEENTAKLELSNRELSKRSQAFKELCADIDKSRIMYVSILVTTKSRIHQEGLTQKPDYSAMTKGELVREKSKEQQNQLEYLDEMISAVKNAKQGNKDIHQQLIDQDAMLDELETGMDANINNISKTRRNLVKLMDSSSYACLIIVIVIEFATIIIMGLLWRRS